MAQRSDVEVWERLIRYHRQTMQRMDERLRVEFGQNLDDYDVLHQLGIGGGSMRMGELAERLLVANSSCHRIVGRLVDRGFVERRADDLDGRVVFVGLTVAGKQMKRRMAAIHRRDIKSLFSSRLSDVEVTQLDAILGRLLDDGATRV